MLLALKRIRYKKNFAIFNKINQRKFYEQFCKNGSKSSDQSSCRLKPVKNFVKVFNYFVAFSEYLNFNRNSTII